MARHIDDQAGIARVAEPFYRGDFAEVPALPGLPELVRRTSSRPACGERRWPRSEPDDDFGRQIMESAKNGEGSDRAGSHVDR